MQRPQLMHRSDRVTYFAGSIGVKPGAGRGRSLFNPVIIGTSPQQPRRAVLTAAATNEALGTLPPEKAYGPHHQEMVVTVEKERLPENLDPEVGQQLQMRQAEGRTIVVTVTDVSESSVTLDANHPLAGQDLSFDIQMVEVLQ